MRAFIARNVFSLKKEKDLILCLKLFMNITKQRLLTATWSTSTWGGFKLLHP